MNWLKTSCLLLLVSGSLLAQVPRDTSYTVASTVTKIQKRYPQLLIEGVRPIFPNSVKSQYRVVYKTLEHRSLPANTFSPKDKERAPAILLIHGGGWRAGSPELMTPIAESLAEAGYFVMVPEYRLSLEAPYPAAVNDLRDALAWIKANAQEIKIDPDQIAVVGCSAGGQLAALVGTTTSVQAIVDVDGVLAFKHPDSSEGTMAAEWLGGTYAEVPEVWQEASALSHVSGSTPPTLFIASKHPRFLAGHQEYMQVLTDAGTYTDIKFMGDAPHSFWLLTPWFDTTIQYITEFLNTTIGNENNNESKK